MNEQQKQARLNRWNNYRGGAYRRWRVYSTFLTGFFIGLFYVILISGTWQRLLILENNEILQGDDVSRSLILVFSGILGGVIYTILTDGHVEMPRFIANSGDKFEAGLFGDILLGIAGAVVLDFIAKSLNVNLQAEIEIAAAGIVGGYGGRAILKFALQRVFKDINLVEEERQRYLQTSLQRRLERMDSLELIDQLNQQISAGLAGNELAQLTAEIKQADLGVRKRIYNLTKEFRNAAKIAGEANRIERSIPIFAALIESDPQQHEYYAELAFAYKDSGSSEFLKAIEYLDRAIALRGNQHRATTWNYELSRAITRIQAAHQTTGNYEFDPAVHERIIADLLAVAEIYNLENILKAVSNENIPLPVMNWMLHNEIMLAAHPKAKILIEQLESLITPTSAAPPTTKESAVASSPLSTPSLKVKTPDNAIPMAGISLIKEFEGYHEKLPNGNAKAYADAIHGWKVPTVGYGTTRYPDGRKVQQGDVITHEDAERYLLAEIEHKCKNALEKIPTWAQMNANQRAALYSFAYNLGAGFYRGPNFNSITKVCDSVDRWTDKAWIEEQFIKYRNPDTPAEAGLKRRRLAEARLFCQPVSATFTKSSSTESASTELTESKPSQNKGKGRLAVRYFPQWDNTRQADRTCNTSSCWMAAMYMKPELWQQCGEDENGDFNYYLPILEKYGDTTDHGAQTRALKELGIVSEWHQTLTLEDVKKEIDKERPVVIGMLHKGHVSHPVGGHIILAVGYNENGLIVHDPYGEIDLINGGYPGSKNGAYLPYSDTNLRPRFEADGPGSGWGRIFP